MKMAENKNTKSTKVWEPNEKQKLFLETVKANPGCTLAELSEIAGVKFASGCINTLVAKGLINNENEKEVIVQAKRSVKVYSVIE
jgi:chromosome segregation and condensation protein ScpB